MSTITDVIWDIITDNDELHAELTRIMHKEYEPFLTHEKATYVNTYKLEQHVREELIKWYEWLPDTAISQARVTVSQQKSDSQAIDTVHQLRKVQGKSLRCAIYARVSSAKQELMGNVTCQVERLQEVAWKRGYQVVALIAEQASSLNEGRRGMKRLLHLIDLQEMDVVLIEYPDRLVRFGFGYLEETFRWKQVRLEVVEPPKVQIPTEERVADVLSVVTVFSGRLYGSRAKKMRSCVSKTRKRLFESSRS